eukprot:3594318-Prymnesium_polylepis.2
MWEREARLSPIRARMPGGRPVRAYRILLLLLLPSQPPPPKTPNSDEFRAVPPIGLREKGTQWPRGS